MTKAYKYEDLWRTCLPLILGMIQKAIETHRDQAVSFKKETFENLGNRKQAGYSFRLDIDNGIVPTKFGSSVARDLKRVLDESEEFLHLAENRILVIRMGKDFVFEVKVIPMTY